MDIPQDLILWPLLFDIFLIYFSPETDSSYFSSYANDITPYVIGNNTTKALC